jgi:hypothetical protein
MGPAKALTQQCAVYDVAEWVLNLRYDSTLVWNKAKALDFG